MSPDNPPAVSRCRSPIDAAQCVGVLGDKEPRTLMINIIQEVRYLGMLCEPLTDVLRRRLSHVVKQLSTIHPGAGKRLFLLCGEALAPQLC